MSRYALNQPILVIGFYTEEDEFTSFPSFNAAHVGAIFNQDFINKVKFKIMSIVPEEMRGVPIEHSKDAGVGYIGYPRIQLPESLLDSNIRIVNQYPMAVYGQLSTHGDLMWRFKDMNGEPILSKLKDEKIPWFYETLGPVIECLETLCNGETGDIYKPLKDAILANMDEEFGAWEIVRTKITPESDAMMLMVLPKKGVEDGDGCSNGPTSALPGQMSSITTLVRCDEHPDRLAVKRIVGESDSFGCEYITVCQQCLDAHTASEKTADRSGTCDWCKQYKPDLVPHRDFEEGFSGRVYDVCGDCVREETKRCREEMGDDDFEPDYDGDDDSPDFDREDWDEEEYP